jgi:hypothetical protein
MMKKIWIDRACLSHALHGFGHAGYFIEKAPSRGGSLKVWNGDGSPEFQQIPPNRWGYVSEGIPSGAEIIALNQ